MGQITPYQDPKGCRLIAPKRGDSGCPLTTPTVGPGTKYSYLLVYQSAHLAYIQLTEHIHQSRSNKGLHRTATCCIKGSTDESGFRIQVPRIVVHVCVLKESLSLFTFHRILHLFSGVFLKHPRVVEDNKNTPLTSRPKTMCSYLFEGWKASSRPVL